MDGDEDLEPYNPLDDSDSDEGAIMMKRSDSKRKLPPMRSRTTSSRPNPPVDSKTIAMLPSTTLKYREDTPEPETQALKHSTWSGRLISPSPSQETIRPSRPSTRILLGDDDDDDENDDDHIDASSSNHFLSRKDSIAVAQERLHFADSTEPTQTGVRRTPSGMFMPLEPDEDDLVAEGLFGKVVDAANTAKDIAHVIWNVGWRR